MSLPWLWSVALLLWSKLWVLAWLSQDRQSCRVHLMVGTLQLKILKSRVDFSHHVLVPVHPCLVAIEVAELRMVLVCLVRVDWPRHGGHLDHGWDLLLGTLVEYVRPCVLPPNECTHRRGSGTPSSRTGSPPSQCVVEWFWTRSVWGWWWFSYPSHLAKPQVCTCGWFSPAEPNNDTWPRWLSHQPVAQKSWVLSSCRWWWTLPRRGWSTPRLSVGACSWT